MMMDESLNQTELTDREQTGIQDDPASKEHDIDSNSSDKTEDSELAAVTDDSEHAAVTDDSEHAAVTDDSEHAAVGSEVGKQLESGNAVDLSEPETISNISTSSNGPAELDVEPGTKAYELNSEVPENKSASNSSLENHQHYSYNTEQILKSIYANSDVSVSSSTVQLLTDGFMKRFVPSLLKAQSSLSQIKSSQSVLIETVQQETTKFTDFRSFVELKETMIKAKQYHNKLLKIRKDMTDLHEKSKRLKKRALKLQQQKQKEELTRAHSMEKEFEKERMLTARMASSHD